MNLIIEKKENFASVLILVVIVYICFYNIMHYDPIQGYDAEGHYAYVDYLSRYLPDNIKLPSAEHSREFFNPPIAYIVPSIAQVVCRNIIVSSDLLTDCKFYYGITLQAFQFLLYLLTLFFNLKTVQIFTNSSRLLNFEYLLMSSLLAVNYKTISMLRGEPYILFFLSVLLYKFVLFDNKIFQISKFEKFQFGLIIGCLALSRQWAFLIFPSFFVLIFYINKNERNRYLKFLLTSFSIGFISSAWFYFNLYFKYGSFTAFNKIPQSFRLSNQPLNFYFPSLNDIYLVFTNPIRPNFSNQFISILYSDTWGDYWGYFVFTSRELSTGRNQELIGQYLARVNIFSLPFTIFLLVSYFLVRKLYANSNLIKFIRLSILISLIGYLWFLVTYPDFPTGDTNKGSYIIQVINLSVLLSAVVVKKLKKNYNRSYNYFIIYLIILFVHNFSSYISHFPFRF